MRWKKLSIVHNSDGSQPWAASHAQVPTPLLLNDDVLRVYYSAWDTQGRGRPAFIDLDARNPQRVLGPPTGPILELGQPGTFDDNGQIVCSVLRGPDNRLFMYYAGFELYRNIRYKIFTGLARSDDGIGFYRVSDAPVLDRSNDELFLRAGPCVLRDGGMYRMWYVAGSEWLEVQGRQMPVYDIRYLESADGMTWPAVGRVVMRASLPDEYGFGRPWVVKTASGYEMYYCIRQLSTNKHRLGWATSPDGVCWQRNDGELGLVTSPGEFDSDTVMSSAVVTLHGKTYCFYNGNDFGRAGFALAVRED
jgi:hypothetical protein